MQDIEDRQIDRSEADRQAANQESVGQPIAADGADTVSRITNGKTNVLDAPSVEPRAQRGGYHRIGFDVALSWAARCPG